MKGGGENGEEAEAADETRDQTVTEYSAATAGAGAATVPGQALRQIIRG